MQPTVIDAQWLYDKTLDSDFVIGDLNLDPMVTNQKGLLEMIGGQKIMLLREATTKRRNQLDYILGHTCSTFSTAFLNFISDHHSVTLRVTDPHRH